MLGEVRTGPLHVLHVFGRMNRGGAEIRTLELLRRLDPREVVLHFCVLSGAPGSLDEEIRLNGGRVHFCRLGLGFRKRFRAIVRSEGIDVVHSHVHYPSGYILREAARLGVECRITHFRNENDGRAPSLSRRFQRWLLRHWIDRYSHWILAVSEGAMCAAWTPEWRSDPRCRVVYNGIEESKSPPGTARSRTRSALGIDPGTAVYIHVARLDPAKNHRRVVRIFAEVLQRNPGARLLMVGRGTELETSAPRREADRLGCGTAVVWMGERGDVRELMEAADVMLFPSLWEGLPGVVLEAVASGLPVVASSISVICEIARVLPSICTVPLAESDRAWADACERSRVQLGSDAARAATAASLYTSPFTAQRSAAELRGLWLRAPQRSRGAVAL